MINLRHSYKSVAISLLFVMIMLIFRHGIFVKREGNVRVTGGQNNTQSARGEDPRGEAPRGSGPIRPRPGAAKGDQVYKFSPEGKPLMTLGKPGDAAEPDHFYQPNDVLVAPNGNTPAASVPRSDLTPARTVLASVSAVGAVEVRGIPIKQDATIFPGDRLRVGDEGYAKVSFTSGHKIELAEKTDITLTNTQDGIQIALLSGTVGFSTVNGISMTVSGGDVEMIASGPAAGHIAVLGTNSIAVRVVNGDVLLRNTKTKESWVVTAGQQRLLSPGSKPSEPLAQIASNIPLQVPSVPPQQPQGGSGSNTSGRSKWRRAAMAWFAEAFGSIVAFTESHGGSPAASAAPGSAHLQSALSTAQRAAAAATQVVRTGDQVVTAVGAAQNISASMRTRLMAEARTLVSQAQASNQRFMSVVAQLQQLQNQLQATSQQDQSPDSTASQEVAANLASIQDQIDATVDSLNAEITVLNQLILELNSLILTAANEGVVNVPNVDLQTVQTAPVASRSLP